MDKTDELIRALDENLIEYKEYTPEHGRCKGMAGLAFLHPNKQETFISYRALADTPIEKIVAYIQNPADVKQLTRIVGYFSYTSGWNKSKIGELKDRVRVNGSTTVNPSISFNHSTSPSTNPVPIVPVKK